MAFSKDKVFASSQGRGYFDHFITTGVTQKQLIFRNCFGVFDVEGAHVTKFRVRLE